MHAQILSVGSVTLTLDFIASRVTHAHLLEHLRDGGCGEFAAHIISGEYALDVGRGVAGLEADAQLFDEDAVQCSDGPGAVDVGHAGGVRDLALVVPVDQLLQLVFGYAELA